MFITISLPLQEGKNQKFVSTSNHMYVFTTMMSTPGRSLKSAALRFVKTS
jgi:hypothetical protein